jgi:transposase
MRYELSDYEWTAIKPMLPNKPTIDCVRSSSAPCFHKRYYSQIADMMRTGSGSLPVSKEHGQTFRRNEIAKTRSASARICIERGT